MLKVAAPCNWNENIKVGGMSIIKSSELAYVRMRLPDLAVAEEFLNAFGLVTVERAGDTLYLRGTDPAHHCYIVEQGPQRMLGFAFEAKTREDLDVLAEATGSAVEPLQEPGGGWRVRLQEPNGYTVEIVHGVAKLDPIVIERQPYNSVRHPAVRANEAFRLDKGKPTPVRRIAHVVLSSPDALDTIAWFRHHLGLIPSDEIYAEEVGGRQIGAFLRVDNGPEYVDHHSLYVLTTPRTGLQHISFEAQDIDAVLADHHYLKSLGRYRHVWGIGRHLLGSQLFDYWHDPFGYVHEHWADSDRFNADVPTGKWTAREGLVNQWGEPPSEVFRGSVQL